LHQSQKLGREDHGWPIVFEPGYAGHRFAYVGYLLASGPCHLITTPTALESAEFRLHLGQQFAEGFLTVDVVREQTPGLRGLVGNYFRARAVYSITQDRHSTRLIVLDGDRYILAFALLFALLRGRPISTSLLLMRAPKVDGQPLSRRNLKGELKIRAARYVAYQPECRVFCLSGTVTDASLVRWPLLPLRDPVSLSESGTRLSRIEAKKQLGWGPETILVVPGALSRRKGILTVVALVSALVDRVELKLIGKVDSDVKSELAAALNGGRVSLRDELISDEDLDRVITAADAVVLLYENVDGPSGLANRSLALGTPIIGSGNSHVLSLIERTGAGVFLAGDELSPSGLSKALASLIDTQAAAKACQAALDLPSRQEFATALAGGPIGK
jgi:glycosyltransferase involved in cell wall biosynthesis